MNRYYLDTEFNSFGGSMISLALVRSEVDSLYLMNADLYDMREEIDPWVAANVLPILHNVPDHVKPMVCSLDMWGHLISSFLYRGDGVPQVIADWPSDIADLCNLLLTGPGMAVDMDHQTHFTILRHIDVYPTTLPNAIQHNAWWDAMALKRYVDETEVRK